VKLVEFIPSTFKDNPASMATVIFYNFILLSSTFFVWASEKGKGNLERYFFLGLAFLLVFVPAAFRYELGVDYFSYKLIYENIQNGLDPFVTSKMEPLYYLLNWVAGALGFSFEVFLILVCFLTYAFLFKSYPRDKVYIYHLVLWAVIYFLTFDKLRSMLAGSVLLYSTMSYTIRPKINRYVFWIVVAGFFHKSAFVFLIFPMVINRGFIKDFFLIKFIIPLFVILLAIFGREMAQMLLNSSVVEVLGYGRYSESWYSQETKFSSGLGVMAAVMFLLYSIVITIAKSESRHRLLYLVVACTAMSIILAANIDIFRRLKILFIIGYPLAVWVLLNYNRTLLSKVAATMMILLCVFDFNRSIINGSTDFMETCSSLRITPYVSIFNKKDSTRDPHYTRFVRWCEAYFE